MLLVRPIRTAVTGSMRVAAIAVLGIVCSLGLVGPAAPSPAAGCAQWKLPAPFVVAQDNGYWTTFVLYQDGSKVWGKAGYAISGATWRFGEKKTRHVVGNVKGGITGNRFFVKVYWTYSGVSSIGVYIGEIDSAGLIRRGRTYDELADRPKVVYWDGRQQMRCS